MDADLLSRLNQKATNEVDSHREVFEEKEKKVLAAKVVIKKLIRAGFITSVDQLPYLLEEAFISIKREDLTKLRKILGERLHIKWKAARNADTIAIYITTESTPNVSFTYTKKYNGKGHCRIIESEYVQPERRNTEFKIVCT